MYLPNENVGKLNKENEQFSSQIAQQRAQFEAVLLQLRDEKAAFEEVQREKYVRNKQHLDGLLKEIQEMEEFNQQVVRDHVDAVATNELEERR